jgi:hypothetical protein
VFRSRQTSGKLLNPYFLFQPFESLITGSFLDGNTAQEEEYFYWAVRGITILTLIL